MIITIDDFFKLRETLPVIDVRSEGEFEDGHIRQAINIPLLNNAERIAVGTDYKQHGQEEAIKTGFRLVGPRLLEIVLEAEKVAVRKEMIVHCWRGGMRSSNFCQFVSMDGIKTHQLAGGYKAYRTAALEEFKKPFSFVVIGGCTGSGKSEIIRALARQGEQVIDLETLANHKGSVFGGLMQSPQPTSEQFQNNLFEEILQLDINKRIWIEDESIAIGKIFLPNDFWQTLNTSPVIEVEMEKSNRINRLVKEYGKADKKEFLQAMERITKKLGGQHFNAAKEKLLQGDMASVIEILLTYYDKAYLNGLEKKKHRVKSTVRWDGKNVNAFTDELVSHHIVTT
ncbi:MAG TPA: tRNA 2-selenouridine(34) synthase MnmH [Cyclobacteriaceae bacterium]|nr:tRNA 2-selenouridine(34) synthase MnmH [Cyclobacteriaceae bacterium]